MVDQDYGLVNIDCIVRFRCVNALFLVSSLLLVSARMY